MVTFILLVLLLALMLAGSHLYTENERLVRELRAVQEELEGLVAQYELEAIRSLSERAKLKAGQVWGAETYFDPTSWEPTHTVLVRERLVPDTKGKPAVIHYVHLLGGREDNGRFFELDTGATVYNMSEQEWKLTFPYLLGEEASS